MLTPRPYQLVGRDFLAGRRFALLADEMRVGKTPQAILAARAVGAEQVLVVCPAIAVPQWHDEFDRWWPDGPMPTVRSYDRAKIQKVDLLSRQWDIVIVDECHFAKNPDAQRTKLIYGKGGLGWCSKRMWALSGTPAPKHAGELWPMLRAFGATPLGYPEYVARYCYSDATGRILGTRMTHMTELKALLAGVMLRRTRKEVAPDMPPISFQFLNVDDVEGAVRADLSRLSGWSDDKLAQYVEASAGGFDTEDRVSVAHAKVPPLVDEITFAINNSLLRQTVVFGWHVEPLQSLARSLVARGVRVGLITGATPPAQRVATQQAFREGRVQVVVANILAAGTAIDLSSASHGYFLELDWVGANNTQAANRLVSMDKPEPVSFDVVTLPGSTDDRVQRVVLRRAIEISALYN